jgi:signal transduction histidine kinase
MSESEQSFDQRLERAKLEAMKELAYGASHEINNPLANISVRAQTLLREERDPDRRRALEAINQQALRAHEMISDLMLFARPPRLDLQPVNLPSLLKQVITELCAECRRREIEVVADDGAAVDEILGDAPKRSNRSAIGCLRIPRRAD